MATDKELKQARAAFDTLCSALDNNDWRYQKNEENMTISCGARGDDLPIDIRIEVDAERMLVMLLSQLPFTAPEDKRTEMAIAVSVINNMLVDGSFDYDIRSGRMVFRISSSFRESLLGERAFMYILLCSCKTVDDFNDKLMMLAKGMLTLDQFLGALGKND